MKSCQEYEPLISAFLDGELSEGERAETAAHLASCPACQRYFDDLVALQEALDRTAAPTPKGFTEAVMARVRETAQEKPAIPFPRWKRWTALAACCAIAALGVWSVHRLAPPSQADRQAAVSGGAPSQAQDAAAPEEGLLMLMEEADTPFLEEAEEEPLYKSASSGTGGNASPSYERDAAEYAVEECAMEPANGSAEDSMLPPAASAPITAGTVAAGGPTARAWVEETLGLPWESGQTYPLTPEEYEELLAALEEAGEEYRQEPGEDRQLLAE